MKILHVITTISLGGAEKQLLTLAKEQIAQGNIVLVIYLQGVPELREDFLECGVRVERAAGSWIFQWFSVRDKIRIHKPDIVHSHLPRAELMTLGNRHRVNSRHNTEPFFPGAPRLISSVLGRIASRRTGLISISHAVSEYIDLHTEVSLKSLRRTIHYGIDIPSTRGEQIDRNEWRESNFSLKRETVLLGTIARLVPQKNLPFLISASAELVKEIPKLKVIILGEGTERPKLEDLIKQLGVEEVVLLPGRRADISSFLQALDVFVLTSNYEGLGLVLLEAIACGVPVVASRNSAIVEVILDGEGLLYQTHNQSDFIKSVTRLIMDPELVGEINRNAIAGLENRFSPSVMSAKIMDLYCDFLKNESRSGQ